MVLGNLIVSVWRHGVALSRRLRVTLPDSTGALMIEAVIGVTVMVSLAAAALVGLSATQRARLTIDTQAIAENIVRNQMEDSFSRTYTAWPNPYPSLLATQSSRYPSEYSVAVTTEEVTAFSGDPDIQKVVVTVSKGNEVILVVETLRGNN